MTRVILKGYFAADSFEYELQIPIERCDRWGCYFHTGEPCECGYAAAVDADIAVDAMGQPTIAGLEAML